MTKTILTAMTLLILGGCNHPSSHNNSSTNDKLVVIDELSYENIPFTKEYNWDDADQYCKAKGWRLPTRNELSKISNIPLFKIDRNNEQWFKDHKKWFVKNKSKQNSNLFIQKIFEKNMAKHFGTFWTVEKDNTMEEGNYHYTINFQEGHIATNEGRLPNNVLCVK